MFGFKGEQSLLGKNVSMLMPEPYRTFHDLYIKRYLDSGGVGRLIGKPEETLLNGQSFNGEIFPITLEVFRQPKGFAGRITLRSVESGEIADTLSCTTSRTGEIINCTGGFSKVFLMVS